MDPIGKIVGKNVALWRKKRGMTQFVLADKADLVHISLQHIEYGRRTPSLKVLFKIAAALDVEPAQLLKR